MSGVGLEVRGHAWADFDFEDGEFAPLAKQGKQGKKGSKKKRGKWPALPALPDWLLVSSDGSAVGGAFGGCARGAVGSPVSPEVSTAGAAEVRRAKWDRVFENMNRAM